ncbi:MAG TPA: hypothetical protein VLK32_09060 [Bacillota bacterium]|nr:hypothetical protein [Bacillota bacterium]
MSTDPHDLLKQLGVDAATIRKVESLSVRHGHNVWRVVTDDKSYVLKWLPEEAARVEVAGSLLLRELGVPTVPIHGSTEQALLLEDLANSGTWRLATPDDLTRPDVARAVARWYRIFHDAGEALLATGQRVSFLAREEDNLSRDTILATGRSNGVAQSRAWDLAAKQIELLQAAVKALTPTFNYNDFYWTNLALVGGEDHAQEAVVFDYHLLGVGLRYSDCRNVTASLSGAAIPAFWEAYGTLDSREETLDRPLATLYTLQTASRMTEFPKWAESSRDRVVNGDLERDLMKAIELARSLLGAAKPLATR